MVSTFSSELAPVPSKLAITCIPKQVKVEWYKNVKRGVLAVYMMTGSSVTL